MNFLYQAARAVSHASPRAWLASVFAALLALSPSLAMASAEASIELRFTGTDQTYLIVSFALGVLSLIFAWIIGAGVNKLSAGSEKMQAVGQAIREGALAYLRQQVKLMAIFVVVLAIGIFALYQGQFGPTVGVWMGITFMAGVAASYIAGYTGMLMAVAGNMRTANAALTSYKQSLEVAFRSGSVAGLVTVGMGLIGATAILWLGGADAMKLLIGFGFGGSLAALFMRVGGGIFTKAADVGADLVGKVEAGIPEDDPRNPATIADNVGDNVGDCAGMAADVFESYEVTLVAAIILGAATSLIFDQATWMRLILFALMARGLGIVASILGIYTVRGSDNIDMDPLKPIRRGFQISAVAAAIGTVILAYFMMGGAGNPIQTARAVSVDEVFRERVLEVKAIRHEIAQQQNIQDWQVSLDDIRNHERFERLQLPAQIAGQLLPMMLRLREAELRQLAPFEGFRQVEETPNEPAAQYTVMRQGPMGDREFIPLIEAFANVRVFVVRRTPDPAATMPGMPEPQVDDFYIMVNENEREQFLQEIDGPPPPGYTAHELVAPAPGHDPRAGHPVVLFSDQQGSVAFAIPTDQPLKLATNLDRTRIGLGEVFALPPDQVRAAFEAQDAKIQEGQALLQKAQEAEGEEAQQLREQASNVMQEAQAMPLPESTAPRPAAIESNLVPWYLFAIAIVFGIVMAFLIEILTDYYVSTHKKPVQEVAGVATAGPAPMIIQGFALGKESSVFSVFAIVISLIAPLIIFPPGEYGGYILSFYGIALVGLGLLTTTGYILAMDTFGPISDNAQGVFEMSGEGHGNEMGSKAVQRLDAAGNTTKALTKGFAIATAVVAAVALFHSYVEDANLTGIGMRLEIPEIFLGLLIGGAAPYLFSAFSINAVGRASFQLINEVRRQFREDPGIMKGTSKPNYASCVAIVTAAAQKELLGPAILAIALPAAVAFGFSIGKDPVQIGEATLNLTGAQALGGFLAGAILSGQLMAVLLANSGGIWDNAKKLIEDGLYGGKGTDAHRAAVVCDTVGDPFKDTAGPAMNPLIKVMNLVALLLAPYVILPLGDGVLITITAVSLAALAFSIWWSKRGSMSSELEAATMTAGKVEIAQTDANPLTVDPGELEAPKGTGFQEPGKEPGSGKKKRITVEDDDDTVF